jgi:hypothetical protein
LELVYLRSDSRDKSELQQIIEMLAGEAERLDLSLVTRSFEDLRTALDFYSAQSQEFSDFVLLWSDGNDFSALTDILGALSVPCLIFGPAGGKRTTTPQFSLDVEDIIAGAIDHMRVLGHRRIAYLGPPDGSAVSRLMREAFVAKMKQCSGEEPSAHLICDPELRLVDFHERIRVLMDLPEAERPTGFVIGAGNFAWSALELCLKDYGLTLGFGPNNCIASGFFNSPFHLVFGDALGYDLHDVRSQLTAAIRSHISDREALSVAQIRRFLPRLTRIESFHFDISESQRKVPRVSL